MLQAYDDEDNVPMVFESLPLPYRIRTWEEVIKEWEGKHNADGKGAVSEGLAPDCASGKGESRVDMPGLWDAVQKTRGAV